jgi:hypothetical protein
MSPTPNPTAQSSGIRLIGGALAFLLLCGTALLGGVQKPKIAQTGLWHGGAKAPLVAVIAYPKDCHRNELRWRFSGEGDDQQDHPFTLSAYPQRALDGARQCGAAQPQRAALIAFSHYRPQTPRAPPLA